MKKVGIFSLLLIIGFGLAYFFPRIRQTPVLPSPCENIIDPVFRELYDQLGGRETLGCGISNIFEYLGVKYQYTVTSLMVFDPQGSASARLRLASIGRDMDITEPPVIQPQGYDVRYVDGHIIFDKFVPLYERLGGMRYVGRPLTEVHFNLNRGRYEQYFENLGMYLAEHDGAEDARLLAYGVWKCLEACEQVPSGSNAVELPYRTAPQFQEAVARLEPYFTGYALSETYQTSDGYLEQVFENVVLVVDPAQPGRVFPRAITEHLGIFPDPPVGPSENPDDTFYPLQGEDKGFNIPKMFADYIALHGGYEATGPPISERVHWEGDHYRQCFTNMCLEEHLDDPDYLRIRPAQLGYLYLKLTASPVVTSPVVEQMPPSSEGEPAPHAGGVPQQQSEANQPESLPPADQPAADSSPGPGTLEQISIQVWETFPQVAPNQNQEIGAIVYDNDGPVAGIEPDITVYYPDGSSKKYYMYPSAGDGQTRMLLEPIQASSGTLIPYEVCIFFPGGQKLCVKDSFLIWENP